MQDQKDIKVTWDYSNLAASYVNRPEYAPQAINALLAMVGIEQNDTNIKICDVGAGVAHLTIPFLQRGFCVDAVEPNDNMRTIGKARTSQFSSIHWYKGMGEDTGMESDTYDLVSFGSSFNVTDRKKALLETSRILKSGGWFCCMWNHRDLDDPLQKEVEAIITKYIPNYDYGLRREDQTKVIESSGLFEKCNKIESPVEHSMKASDWVDAWRSHATLERQAGSNFHKIIGDIEKLIISKSLKEIIIPYTTRVWLSKLQDGVKK